jgi:acyl dehydratase
MAAPLDVLTSARWLFKARGRAMSAIEMKDYLALTGKEIGVSKWFEIAQQRINEFADVTEDWQFIHIDPKEAAKTPFGGTVAHGFLTLSMLPAMAYDAMPIVKGRVMAVNYGFEKIRFVAPVRSGSRVRAKFKLLEVTPRNPQEFMSKSEVFVEIEGSEKPALTAEWLGISYFAEPVAV